MNYWGDLKTRAATQRKPIAVTNSSERSEMRGGVWGDEREEGRKTATDRRMISGKEKWGELGGLN